MAFHRAFPRAWPLLAAATLLAACKSVDVPKVPGITPYRMVIQQGNYISQEMVGQLKPGMTKEQVRFVLGTPLVTDIFHADRWDYVFFREMPDGKRDQRNLSVVFENDKLARIIGDLLPPAGAAPAAAGFESQQKVDTAPRSIGTGKPAAKPQATPEAAKVEPPKAEQSGAEPAKPSAMATPAEEARAAQQAQAAGTSGAAEQQKTGDEPKERGFFGRMLEKIGL